MNYLQNYIQYHYRSQVETLAEKIISSSKSQKVKEICSGDFLENPTDHLVNLMIQRGVGMCRDDDGARATVAGQIPGFYKTISTPEYLKNFAIGYFKNHPNKEKVMAVFEKSLASNAFKTDLQNAIETHNAWKEQSLYYSEGAFRVPLTIFNQSENGEEYVFPEHSNLEMCCVSGEEMV